MQTINTAEAAKKWVKLNKSEKMQAVRDDFEKTYGKDAETRTAQQWKNLVTMYGMETVCATEKLTQPQVLQKMSETFSKRLDRQIKNKRIK
jgi:hypothetical protein